MNHFSYYLLLALRVLGISWWEQARFETKVHVAVQLKDETDAVTKGPAGSVAKEILSAATHMERLICGCKLLIGHCLELPT